MSSKASLVSGKKPSDLKQKKSNFNQKESNLNQKQPNFVYKQLFCQIFLLTKVEIQMKTAMLLYKIANFHSNPHQISWKTESKLHSKQSILVTLQKSRIVIVTIVVKKKERRVTNKIRKAPNCYCTYMHIAHTTSCTNMYIVCKKWESTLWHIGALLCLTKKWWFCGFSWQMDELTQCLFWPLSPVQLCISVMIF